MTLHTRHRQPGGPGPKNGLLYCHPRPRSIPIFRIFHRQK
ncbi:Uncharacterized protein FWK35_00028202, partial [Aphis craccivora]